MGQLMYGIMENIINLNCLIYGNLAIVDHAFSIKIGELLLWKVNIPMDKNELHENISFRNNEIVKAVYEVSNYWKGPQDIPKENVHVIFKDPQMNEQKDNPISEFFFERYFVELIKDCEEIMGILNGSIGTDTNISKIKFFLKTYTCLIVAEDLKIRDEFFNINTTNGTMLLPYMINKIVNSLYVKAQQYASRNPYYQAEKMYQEILVPAMDKI
ncbi:hypothetical protein C1645_824697 [Glomus cerebriforme]|uniref:Uncharacterized protein n=1 Tax=Glomus cerebriforme TaxID=658196 RepID=A0A397T013_9GLOM|nr:hypothetical protein C1645_824697 [Glomus cerebriforme]